MLVYFRGVRRMRRRAPGGGIPRWQVASFAGGCLAVAVSLLSPLDPLSDLLFSAHMTQHELLILVAAPLFALSRPLVPMLWSLPAAWRHRIGAVARSRTCQSLWRGLTGAFTVWLVHGLTLWAWHVPALFEAALRDERIHAVQHLCFFVTAFLFWWALVHGRYGRLGYGAAVVFVFTTAVHSAALGALLTLAPTMWYPIYGNRAPAWVLSPLEDQQLAGLIMWVPTGVIFILAGLALFAAWIGESERRVSYGRTDAVARELSRRFGDRLSQEGPRRPASAATRATKSAGAAGLAK